MGTLITNLGIRKRSVAEGTIDQVSANQRVIEVYLGR